jgi:hypothetical protein
VWRAACDDRDKRVALAHVGLVHDDFRVLDVYRTPRILSACEIVSNCGRVHSALE